MATVYFIGGAPRSGKSTVLQELLKKRPVPAASTDAIRSVAFGLSSAKNNPRLFRVERGDFGSESHIRNMTDNPELVLRQEVASAEETWKSVRDFIHYYERDGKDVAVEGVAVLPNELKQLDTNYKTVFIAHLDDQTDSMLCHARENPDDWLNKYNETVIRAYAKFNQAWNNFYIEQAKKNELPLITVDRENFQESIRKAVSVLLK